MIWIILDLLPDFALLGAIGLVLYIEREASK